MGTKALSVGTTQEELVKLDLNRKSLTIFNTHASATLYFKEGNDVSSSNGIPVKANQTVGITFRDDGELVFQRFMIVASGASTTGIAVEGFDYG